MKVLFEDEFMLGLSKPSGLLTHPSNECRHIKESLLFVARDYYGSFLYPINRLDRAVSGVILMSKSKDFVSKMQAIWTSESTQKEYLALCHGKIEQKGSFEFDLGNDQKVKQKAITQYIPIMSFDDSTYLRVSIKTGRRHQIRRHFSRRMHALLGDRKYGKKKWNDDYLERFNLRRIFLHSHKTSFVHPISNQHIQIQDPLPTQLENVITSLNEIK